MSKDSYTRSRRKHLKNLRKIQKSTRSISGSTDTRRKSSSRSDSMINLGLVFGAVVLVILLGSAILEYKGNISTHLFNKTGREKSALLKVNPEAVEVRVLNGCGVAGASRNMMSYLRDLHFDVVYVDNAENFTYEHTLVLNHSRRPEVGLAVSEALGCKHLSYKEDNMAMADVTVILGRDWEKFLVKRDEKKTDNMIDKVLTKARSLLGLD